MDRGRGVMQRSREQDNEAGKWKQTIGMGKHGWKEMQGPLGSNRDEETTNDIKRGKYKAVTMCSVMTMCMGKAREKGGNNGRHGQKE